MHQCRAVELLLRLPSPNLMSNVCPFPIHFTTALSCSSLYQYHYPPTAFFCPFLSLYLLLYYYYVTLSSPCKSLLPFTTFHFLPTIHLILFLSYNLKQNKLGNTFKYGSLEKFMVTIHTNKFYKKIQG